MSEFILETNNLKEEFPEKTVLHDLSFKLKRGTFLSIVGENGVGKTTLIKIILGQLKPSNGTVTFPDKQENIKIGYVPQFRNIDDEYQLSVKNFIGLNFSGYHLPWLTPKEKLRLNKVLQQTNLSKLQNESMGQASGGEKQRAYLAQALVNEPDLLILDESTASLDPVAKEDLLNLVRELNQKTAVTVIFVTHDIPLAQQFSDEYLLLKSDGFETGPIGQLKITDYEGGQEHV